MIKLPEEFNIQYCWGEYEHGVDDKGRVIVPQDFRAPLGEDIVATRGPDHCIYLFSKPVWDYIEKALRTYVMERNSGFLLRMLGSRTIVRTDPQARIAVPKALRDWAGISNSQTAVFVGQGSKIELWGKKEWDQATTAFTGANMYDALETLEMPSKIQKDATVS